MSGQFVGALTAKTRDEVTAKARQAARDYFGTCVDIAYGDAELSDDGVRVRFAAVESHHLWFRAYGPAYCKWCEAESWPHRPLPTALATAPTREEPSA